MEHTEGNAGAGEFVASPVPQSARDGIAAVGEEMARRRGVHDSIGANPDDEAAEVRQAFARRAELNREWAAARAANDTAWAGRIGEEYAATARVLEGRGIVQQGTRALLSVKGVHVLAESFGLTVGPRTARAVLERTVPDEWAPLNRRGEPYRDAVDAFRNLRMAPPERWTVAVNQMHLALELYEHARENERAAVDRFNEHADGEAVLRERLTVLLMTADPKATPTPTDEQRAEWHDTLGPMRSASSRTAAEKLVDVTPAMIAHLREHRRRWMDKADAEKETSVARRRLNTATTTVETWQEPPALAEAAEPFDAGALAADVLAGNIPIEDALRAARESRGADVRRPHPSYMEPR